MTSLAVLPTTLLRWGRLWAEGAAAVWGLGREAVAIWRKDGRKAILPTMGPALLKPEGQRRVFAVLRAFQPNLALKRPFVKAYGNSGAVVIVTRRSDVLEVLSRDADFEVVYGPRMRTITGGADFFLGMQPGWPYERDVSAMRLAARRSDVPKIVLPLASRMAREIVDAAPGALDVAADLAGPIPAAIVETYFGVTGPDRADLIDWTTTLFHYLFVDLAADPALGARAEAAAAALRDRIGALVAERKGSEPRDDVLGRCLALQAAGTPGMDDRGIRDNLVGLAIGAVPTIAKAATLALDALFDRPGALSSAQAAAAAGDAARLEGFVWEALRFNPHNPVIYRRAVRDATIAAGAFRAQRVKQGAMVFAANHSAMFDPLAVPDPAAFRPDRPFETYIHWGYGLHRCFGDAINRAAIPAILAPLLAKPGLRRVALRDDGGTPFPKSLKVAWG
jgi:cytochrome P450